MPSANIFADEKSPLKGWIALIAATLIWSTPPIFARYFASDFNSIEQSCFRYIFGCASLWLYVLFVLRGRMREYRPRWGLISAGAISLVVYQLGWVTAVYFIFPAMMHLLLKLNIVLGAVMAYFFDHSEREVVTSRAFILGSMLALGGAMGLIVADPGFSFSLDGGSRNFLIGVALSGAAVLTWPAYSLVAKRATAGQQHPMVVFIYINTLVCIVFAGLNFFFGDYGKFFAAPLSVQALLAFSGVLCLIIAHWVYLIAMKHVGVAISLVVLLTSPFITYIFSYLMFDEKLSPIQIVCAGVLLAGCGGAVLVRRGQIVD